MFKAYLDQLEENLNLNGYQGALVEEISQLYPLAILLASEYIERLAESLPQIPLLVSETYRDGLRWKHKTIVLPLGYRKAWFEDDLTISHVSHIRLLDKSTRHRANKVLRKHKLLNHQIVSVISYYLACEKLISLGYQNYEISRQKLKKLYPKSLKNL